METKKHTILARIQSGWKSRLRDLIFRPDRQLTRLGRFGLYLYRLAIQIWRQLVRDKCLERASALAYTSVLSIVPILAVAFAIFRMTGAVEDIEGKIKQYAYTLLVPESVTKATDFVDAFLKNVSSGALGAMGLAFLIFTATWLFITVEGTVNSVWRVRESRSITSQFKTFWSLLTLGPVLIAIGFYLTAKFQSSEFSRALERIPYVLAWLTALVPYLVSIIPLALLNKLLPNTRVRWGPALMGGLVSGILFEVAKKGFNLYVALTFQGSANVKIYGSFALFPVFLLWIYIVWVVVLFGVEVAYTTQNLRVLYEEYTAQRTLKRLEEAQVNSYVAARVFYHIAQRHWHGAEPYQMAGLAQELKTGEGAVSEAARRLALAGLLQIQTSDDGTIYLPRKAIERVTVEDVVTAFKDGEPGPGPDVDSSSAWPLDVVFNDLAKARRVRADETFGDLIAASIDLTPDEAGEPDSTEGDA